MYFGISGSPSSQARAAPRAAPTHDAHQASALHELVALAAAAGQLVASGVDALLAAHGRLDDERVRGPRATLMPSSASSSSSLISSTPLPGPPRKFTSSTLQSSARRCSIPRSASRCRSRARPRRPRRPRRAARNAGRLACSARRTARGRTERVAVARGGDRVALAARVVGRAERAGHARVERERGDDALAVLELEELLDGSP